jgi:hypothetical protein
MDQVIQVLSTAGVVCVDIYRNVMGSMLVLFVPATCGNHPCNPLENLMNGNTIYLCAVGCNFATLLSFLILLGIEFRRENWLNHYLIVNHELPMNTGNILTKLTEPRQQKLHGMMQLYQRWVYITLAIYMANIGFSAYIIFTDYMDLKTPVSLVTNTLLIGAKLYDVHLIAGADSFVSAYKRSHVRYNDVNPQKALVLTEI